MFKTAIVKIPSLFSADYDSVFNGEADIDVMSRYQRLAWIVRTIDPDLGWDYIKNFADGSAQCADLDSGDGCYHLSLNEGVFDVSYEAYESPIGEVSSVWEIFHCIMGLEDPCARENQEAAGAQEFVGGCCQSLL